GTWRAVALKAAVFTGRRFARDSSAEGQYAGGVLSFSFTHLALEGRMTVTIGRRESLAALGGAAARGARCNPAGPPVARCRRGDQFQMAAFFASEFRGARRGLHSSVIRE